MEGVIWVKLSNNLISEFVKITNDTKSNNNQTSAYGTTVNYNGVLYVRLDGSDALTPVDTTTEISENDRVLVDINNHTATVTGNITSPAASVVTAENLRSEIKQTAESLSLTFKEGYKEGNTTVNQNGIYVKHTDFNGYTHMAAHGFSLYKDGNVVFSCTENGLNYTGTITASIIKSNDGTFKIDKDGSISGASLSSSKGGNFEIDENGFITAAGLSVEGSISSNKIVCNEISNKAYPKTLTGTVNLWVDQTNGDDDNECVNDATFKTFQAAVNSIPKFMNGKTVNIYLSRDYTGNVNFTYFTAGRIYVFLRGHKLNGSIHFYHTTAAMYVYGGESTSSTSYGIVHASTGLNLGDRSTTISINVCRSITLYYLEVYAPDTQASGLTGDKVCVAHSGTGYSYIRGVKVVNCNVGFRANSTAHMHFDSSSGVASKYGFQATTGSTMTFANNAQAGGSTAATNRGAAAEFRYDGATFATGSTTSSSTTATTTTTTTTKTYTASSAQALQYAGTSSAFWRTDCLPKVGDWGYGAHTGWWFFGDDFENMASKDVTKIEITFTRNKAGNYAATSHNFYVHNYETQPSTKSPTYNSSKIASASVAVEKTHTISITDSTIINRIKSAKGICSVPTSQSSTYYSVMSATMKVKFTYKS